MANLDEIQIKITQESNEASEAIDSLIDSLEKLGKATELGKAASNINSLSGSVKNLSDASKNLNLDNIGAKLSGIGSATFKGLKSIAGWGVSLATLAKGLQNSLKLGTEYTQTVNMLNTVMGEGADEAKAFAENLGDVLGLNPADVMNFQATFQNLFVGFGNNAKQAQIMSKNLTQLSYDMAAFYKQLGGDPEAAAEKLRLAMAGTIEPIQRLGYAIKEADLQAVAARQGININVRNLNTASKSMLRYIAVMEQSTHVQGYMAKSFESPATAIIVFKSAIKQLSTEIGKTFLPMLMAAIPYMQAFVTGILNMVKTINGILGIELPEIKWDESKEGISGIGDEALETGKKMKKAFMLGIDELNVLDNSTSDASSGFQDITNLLKLPEYDMLEGFSGEKVKEIQERLKPLQGLFDGLANAFAGFYNSIKWLGEDLLYPWLVSLGDWMESHPNTMWLIGNGLGWIAGGMLALKVLGGAGALLGLPNLFKNIGDGMIGVYNASGKKLQPTLAVLGKKIGGVALLTLALYSALELLKTIIDIKQGEIQGWEAFRQVAGWTATTIGLVGLALVAFGVIAGGVLFAAITALGLVLAKWNDFAFGVQIVAAYLGKFIYGILQGIATAAASVIVGISFGIVEAIYGIIWVVLKAIEKFTEVVLSKVKSVAEIADSILGTEYAAKIKTDFDFTSGIEERMQMTWDGLKGTMSDLWGQVADTFKADVWESDYLQTAQDLYLESQEGKDDTSAIEEVAGQLRGMFDNYTASNEQQQKELEELANKQVVSNELQTTANELQTTANTIQTEYNASSLEKEQQIFDTLEKANMLEKTSTSDITSIIKSIGSDIVSALRQVEDACRDIKINIHNHYGGGGEGYATGGYPTSGEYFFAREDGMPELVGRVGRQTAVMNNGQIADTMAQSLIRAMGQGGGVSQPQVIENKLYLDGEVVYSNQQKIQRSKGYNLGMGVFANV